MKYAMWYMGGGEKISKLEKVGVTYSSKEVGLELS